MFKNHNLGSELVKHIFLGLYVGTVLQVKAIILS